MTAERPENPRARLFIALDLPAALRTGIAAWGERELTDAALRPVPLESIHITLAFLGHRPEVEIERLAEIVKCLSAAAPTIELGDPVAKPSRRRPGLFALTVDSPGAVALQAELAEKLVSSRLHRPEKRPFWPHVTVARVKPEGRGSRRPRAVDRPPGALPLELLEPGLCVRATLYRSDLNPQGARYTPLAQVKLSEDGRQ